jgi:hypothetical protein
MAFLVFQGLTQWQTQLLYPVEDRVTHVETRPKTRTLPEFWLEEWFELHRSVILSHERLTAHWEWRDGESSVYLLTLLTPLKLSCHP